MTDALSRLLAEKGVLLADGATGTNLFEMGLHSGEAPEMWLETHPERIESLHQSFVDAGADIILSCSFGANRHRLKLHQAEDRTHDLNRIAAEIARKVADGAGRPVIVAGSVGPTGEILEPIGALSYAEAVEAFREQIEGLKAGGADVAWIETMSAADEVRAAVEAAVACDMPYVFTGSFDSAGRTMMGIHPRDFWKSAEGIQPAPIAIGANCGVGASDMLATGLELETGNPDTAIVLKANCGIPRFVDGQTVYSGTAEQMADYTRLAIDAGARIIGGCCGTAPGHLAAMRHALDTHHKRQRPTIETIVETVGPLVNKQAFESGSDGQGSRGRRSRRGSAEA
ncbi:betaine--homocysteine S-methyltransferase [Antarcticirhabdus aurantiaca]|uniref:Betaine--homocysteine S-methyltransferase n=1 Tax=Antarcticirhabdus aurantiaca TaxID=2606717 RepID=A0ACD4NU46_9HYPH|nr:betaine--homocysteine S-methyltransferase [Antarcticirhabdus aurantiaca]WAJ30580.1 betaine--homocysteine S-methyltransferase [Jeongeuplla avenae]